MDILYIIGRGSKHDNMELRMSLRSISRYGKGIDRVIVAGYPCDWLSHEVIKVPIEDKYCRKHLNIMHCIKQIIELGLLYGEFLYSSDDHFYTKPTDFNNYPYYSKGVDLKKRAIKGTRHYGYHMSLVETRALLEKHHLPVVNYEQHCNTHMHTQVLKAFPYLVEESLQLERGAAPTSLIMNAWMTTGYAPTDIENRKDIKINAATSVEDIKAQIGESECFSIGDSAFKGSSAIIDYFRQEFPRQCRYEK